MTKSLFSAVIALLALFAFSAAPALAQAEENMVCLELDAGLVGSSAMTFNLSVMDMQFGHYLYVGSENVTLTDEAQTTIRRPVIGGGATKNDELEITLHSTDLQSAALPQFEGNLYVVDAHLTVDKTTYEGTFQMTVVNYPDPSDNYQGSVSTPLQGTVRKVDCVMPQ